MNCTISKPLSEEVIILHSCKITIMSTDVDLFAQFFGEECTDICQWIKKTNSYVFGDVIPHLLCKLAFEGEINIFVGSQENIESWSFKTTVNLILMRHSLQEITELQPLTCLQCWFNGVKIIGNYVKQTKSFEMSINPKYSGDTAEVVEVYTRLGFKLVEQKVRVKALSLKDKFLLDGNAMYEKLIKDEWFATRIDRDDSKEKILEKAYDLVAKATSARDGYTQWVVNSYISNGIRSLEDLGRVKSALISFGKLLSDQTFTDARDLNKYCGLIGCLGVQGLEEVLAKYVPPDESSFLSTLPREDVIYEDSNVMVAALKSKRSAMCWGKNTRWCTAADQHNMFDYYNSKGRIYVILDKVDPSHKRYQLHGGSKQVMDIHDKPVTLTWLYKNYPRALRKRVTTRGPVWKPDIISYVEYCMPDDTVIDGLVEAEKDFKYGDFSLRKVSSRTVQVDVEGEPLKYGPLVPTSVRFCKGDPEDLFLRSDLRGVHELNLDCGFNVSLVGVNLHNVKVLKLSNGYNQSLVGVDFQNVEELVLEYDYVQSLKGVEFKGIKKLKIASKVSLVGVDFGSVEVLEVHNMSLVGVDLRGIKELHTSNMSLDGVDLCDIEVLKYGPIYRGYEGATLHMVDLKNVKELILKN